MSRRAYPSATLSATVRERLGLTRAELGLLLGVGVSQVGHVEAGRWSYSAAAQARLRRLASLVPASTCCVGPGPRAGWCWNKH
jgi:DNA-binding transcriptional regulator YiaG